MIRADHTPEEFLGNDNPNYRPLSTLAVVALALGLMTLALFFTPLVSGLAGFTVLVGFLAQRNIEQRDLHGRGAAKSAVRIVIVALVLAIGIYGWQQWLYAAEKLPDHEHVNFWKVTTTKENLLDAYDGQQICLKGYALFGHDRNIARRSILFSPNGREDDESTAIFVQLPAPWEWNRGPIAISGILVVDRNATTHSSRYHLKANAVRDAASNIGLSGRYEGDGC